MCRIRWAPNNVSRWQVGFNLAFKGLTKLNCNHVILFTVWNNRPTHKTVLYDVTPHSLVNLTGVSEGTAALRTSRLAKNARWIVPCRACLLVCLWIRNCAISHLSQVWQQNLHISHIERVVCGPGISVGIVTGYGLDGPGIESRWGRDFPHLSRPALGSTQPPVQRVPRLSRG
jgi:hypothetical protein